MSLADLYPLVLSLKVAFFATVLNVIAGTILAYILASRSFFGKNLIDALIMQPLIMPPTVLGYYLLVVLGRNSLIGGMYENVFGSSLVFTWQGAVLAASIASLPLFIKPARSAFETVNPNYKDSARLLGSSELSVFFYVTLPLARKGVLAGMALAFARSLGEFGTTLMVAGNIPGKTQTLSIAIYDAVQAGNNFTANILVGVITIISIIILFMINKTLTKQY